VEKSKGKAKVFQGMLGGRAFKGKAEAKATGKVVKRRGRSETQRLAARWGALVPLRERRWGGGGRVMSLLAEPTRRSPSIGAIPLRPICASALPGAPGPQAVQRGLPRPQQPPRCGALRSHSRAPRRPLSRTAHHR